jgi:glucose/arabinose dehydrogenase
MKTMIRRLLGAFATVLALCAFPAIAAADPALPEGFQDEVVFDNLEQPTDFRFVPGPDERVFVADKPGRIWVYEDTEDNSPTLFADLRGSVYDNGDRGLLGLELDPEFTEGRPYVYALYTWDHVLGETWNPSDPKYGVPGTSGDPGCPAQNSSSSCLVSGRLVRLTEDTLIPDKAEYEGIFPKEKELLQGWCQQFSSHSIGELQFGTEGALYVSGGDGAAYESIADYGQLGTPPYANACGDPPSPAGTPLTPPSAEGGALRSQNLKLLNGAILRLDPDTGDAFPGNPLAANSDENAQRTIAKGFRNPFRFTFDPQTGEIYSGNVGSSEIEEIDRFQAPPSTLFNSGWPCFEGVERHWQFRELGLNVCEAMYGEEPSSASLPFFTYSHGQAVVPDDECPTEAGSAVGGISFYEGTQFPPKYKGALFFADAVRGCVWAMLEGADGKPDPNTTFRFMREGRVYPGVKIAEGPDGYIYYASLSSEEGIGFGAIHRIAYRPNSPTARLEAKPPFGLYDGSDEFKTTLDAGGSSDPNSKPLIYEWDLEEDGTFVPGGSQKAVTFTKAEQEDREDNFLSPNRVVAVRVEDDEGFSSIARVTVYPGDKPPVPTIVSPDPSFEWGVGDEVELYADAEDAEGEPIEEPLPYYWQTRMAHCPDPANPTACHVHPMQTFAGLRYAKFIAPQHDYPSYIEVVLRVSDQRGLSGTTTMKIDPRTVNLSIASNPPGIELLAGETKAISPFTVPAIDGSQIFISAPPTATLDGRAYTFLGWSDGKDRAHAIDVSPAQTKYTASYTTPADPPPPPPGPPVRVPATTLGKHPPKATRSTTAKFTFGSSTAGATFRCKLDAKRTLPCRSPKTYKRLKPGRHTFKVWATAGVLTDPTPAKFSWKVLPSKK